MAGHFKSTFLTKNKNAPSILRCFCPTAASVLSSTSDAFYTANKDMLEPTCSVFKAKNVCISNACT